MPWLIRSIHKANPRICSYQLFLFPCYSNARCLFEHFLLHSWRIGSHSRRRYSSTADSYGTQRRFIERLSTTVWPRNKAFCHRSDVTFYTHMSTPPISSAVTLIHHPRYHGDSRYSCRMKHNLLTKAVALKIERIGKKSLVWYLIGSLFASMKLFLMLRIAYEAWN